MTEFFLILLIYFIRCSIVLVMGIYTLFKGVTPTKNTPKTYAVKFANLLL